METFCFVFNQANLATSVWGGSFVCRSHFVAKQEVWGAVLSRLGDINTMGHDCLVLVLLALLALTRSQGSNQKITIVAVGNKIILELDPKQSVADINRVVWKHGDDLLADMTLGEFSYYGTFEGHTKLEKSGRLTVSNIELGEGGKYSVEINEILQDISYHIDVYEVLTQPSIRVGPLTCGTDPAVQCTLVCELEPMPSTAVSYEWELEGEVSKISGKELNISHTTKARNLTCRAKNPVGERTSESIKNPFFKEPPSDNLLPLWVILGLVVPLSAVGGVVYYFKKCRGTSDLTRAHQPELQAMNRTPGVDSQNKENGTEDSNSGQPQDGKGTTAS